MKKSICVLLCIIIVVLLIVIAVGSAVMVKRQADYEKEVITLSSKILELNNELYNKEETENAETNEVKENVTNNTDESIVKTKTKTLDDIVGKYQFVKNEAEADFLYLAQDGTFGYFMEIGGLVGSYSFDGENIILSPIIVCHTDLCLELTKKTTKTKIKEDGKIEIDSKEFISPQSEQGILKFTKISNSVDDFDIRQYIKEGIGSGPEYHFLLDY